jgi:hypothetical protein
MTGLRSIKFAVVLAVIFCAAWSTSKAPQKSAQPGDAPASLPAETFGFVDVIVTTDSPLAAYQVDVRLTGAKLLGVEGSDHAAFKSAPYYDPAALMNDRVILAAFSLDKSLPAGPTRVARLHLQLSPGATWQPTLTVAADVRGNPIPGAVVSARLGEASK